MNKQDLRIVKTIDIISQSFLDCLEKKEFKQLTVKDITEKARINRSTFYKYYMDKYDLLDKFIDNVLKDFHENLDADFIDLPCSDLIKHRCQIEKTIAFFLSQKRTYVILWNADINRNVFDEMLRIGENKIFSKIENNTVLHLKSQDYSKLYSKLFLANMMASIRWWFELKLPISAEHLSEIMIQNMTKGIFNTFKSDLISDKS
jgi:AcrR family transcriptional regulator